MLFRSPVTSLELKEVLKRVKASLDEEAKQKAQIESIQKEYNKNIPVLRERFLRKLIEEKRSEERRVGKECCSHCRSLWSPCH